MSQKYDMYAIATLVMGNDSYINAAITLAKSCIPYTVGRELELVCMVTDDIVDHDRLIPYYHHVVHVDKIHVDDLPILGGESATKIYTWVSDACTKWNVLGLSSYEKVLFLDADMIVVQDIYSLFSMHTPAGSFDHPCSKEYVLDNRWTGDRRKGDGFINWYRSYLQLYNQPLTHGSLILPSSIDNLRLHSNIQFSIQGGIALLSPDIDLLSEYKRDLPKIVKSLYMREKGSSNRYVRTERTLSAIDEISILLFFHDRGYRWTHIDHSYDVAAFHTYSIIQNDAKIIHYMGRYKPWNSNEREYVASRSTDNDIYHIHHLLVEKWWNIYNEDISIT